MSLFNQIKFPDCRHHHLVHMNTWNMFLLKENSARVLRERKWMLVGKIERDYKI